ncbi:hypothetical protein C2E23DRAFT_890017 [Lenzites betulinus]|nr:hypothetical protein C2E23DRAFT_890017 [Lenzites betulinus]
MEHAHTPTRSGRRESLTMSAHSFPVRRDVNIASRGGLETFVLLGHYNANIGRVVEDFRITLPDHEGYPAHELRAALRLTPNIECLVLNLPVESPVTLLNGLQFPNLRVFSSNLPHRVLSTFLAAHPLLVSLALRGSCGRSAQCPLQGLELHHLSDLQCPSRCFVGIARGSLVTATVNLTRLTSMSSLAIQTLSSSRLYSLAVDYHSTDYDVLSRVAMAIPNLRKLKLNEKPHNQRRYDHSRRPWNDLRSWHRILMTLPHLEELMLRTLTSIAGPTRTESNVVDAWARGIGQRATAHPSLFYIALIQKNTEDGQTGQLLTAIEPGQRTQQAPKRKTRAATKDPDLGSELLVARFKLLITQFSHHLDDERLSAIIEPVFVLLDRGCELLRRDPAACDWFRDAALAIANLSPTSLSPASPTPRDSEGREPTEYQAPAFHSPCPP